MFSPSAEENNETIRRSMPIIKKENIEENARVPAPKTPTPLTPQTAASPRHTGRPRAPARANRTGCTSGERLLVRINAARPPRAPRSV
ncbi:hypothetical protein B0H17DRAFT_1101849 [Mycena rosella]|uniref:Uncharacterized protein n=1 Tax=Mycena rosella TaxID=1033263 RepID=A0AAD7FSC5_MYCRO|nr:hypothetical protein B0H17DRAFT_1105370 [Mycena rosella]KAJ7651898.1 hypothetical protein B0H17DRAFT_1101849 [Mycena rosella]